MGRELPFHEQVEALTKGSSPSALPEAKRPKKSSDQLSLLNMMKDPDELLKDFREGSVLDNAQDLGWLAEVHAVPLATKHQVAVIYGNDDAPDAVALYARNSQACDPTILLQDENGDLQVVRWGEDPTGVKTEALDEKTRLEQEAMKRLQQWPKYSPEIWYNAETRRLFVSPGDWEFGDGPESEYPDGTTVEQRLLGIEGVDLVMIEPESGPSSEDAEGAWLKLDWKAEPAPIVDPPIHRNGLDHGGRGLDGPHNEPSYWGGSINLTRFESFKKVVEAKGTVGWFNPRTEAEIEGYDHHAIVRENPEVFGLTDEDLQGDLRQLVSNAVKAGWVRVNFYGGDLFLQGMSEDLLRKAYWHYYEDYPVDYVVLDVGPDDRLTHSRTIKHGPDLEQWLQESLSFKQMFSEAKRPSEDPGQGSLFSDSFDMDKINNLLKSYGWEQGYRKHEDTGREVVLWVVWRHSEMPWGYTIASRGVAEDIADQLVATAVGGPRSVSYSLENMGELDQIAQPNMHHFWSWVDEHEQAQQQHSESSRQSFESLLKEANLQPDEWANYAQQLGMSPEELQIRVGAVDPTGDRTKYADWIVKQMIAQGANWDMAASYYDIGSLLQQFDQLKQRQRVQGDAAEIRNYDLDALKSAVEWYGQGHQSARSEVDTAKAAIVNDGGEIVAESGPWLLVRIANTEVAQSLCSEGGWCLKDPVWSQYYLQGGPTYILYSTKRIEPSQEAYPGVYFAMAINDRTVEGARTTELRDAINVWPSGRWFNQNDRDGQLRQMLEPFVDDASVQAAAENRVSHAVIERGAALKMYEIGDEIQNRYPVTVAMSRGERGLLAATAAARIDAPFKLAGQGLWAPDVENTPHGPAVAVEVDEEAVLNAVTSEDAEAVSDNEDAVVLAGQWHLLKNVDRLWLDANAPTVDEPTFESMLGEGKLQDRQWKDAWEQWTWGEQYASLADWKAHIAAVDPTGKKLKYASFLVTKLWPHLDLADTHLWHRKRELGPYARDAKRILAQFAKLVSRKLLKGDNANLDTYESIEAVETVVDQLIAATSAEADPKKWVASAGGEIAYRDDLWLVVKIPDGNAAAKVGCVGVGNKEAPWCTRFETNFADYSHEPGGLHFILSQDEHVTPHKLSCFAGKWYFVAAVGNSDDDFEFQDGANKSIGTDWLDRYDPERKLWDVLTSIYGQELIDKYLPDLDPATAISNTWGDEDSVFKTMLLDDFVGDQKAGYAWKDANPEEAARAVDTLTWLANEGTPEQRMAFAEQIMEQSSEDWEFELNTFPTEWRFTNNLEAPLYEVLEALGPKWVYYTIDPTGAKQRALRMGSHQQRVLFPAHGEEVVSGIAGGIFVRPGTQVYYELDGQWRNGFLKAIAEESDDFVVYVVRDEATGEEHTIPDNRVLTRNWEYLPGIDVPTGQLASFESLMAEARRPKDDPNQGRLLPVGAYSAEDAEGILVASGWTETSAGRTDMMGRSADIWRKYGTGALDIYSQIVVVKKPPGPDGEQVVEKILARVRTRDDELGVPLASLDELREVAAVYDQDEYKAWVSKHLAAHVEATRPSFLQGEEHDESVTFESIVDEARRPAIDPEQGTLFDNDNRFWVGFYFTGTPAEGEYATTIEQAHEIGQKWVDDHYNDPEFDEIAWGRPNYSIFGPDGNEVSRQFNVGESRRPMSPEAAHEYYAEIAGDGEIIRDDPYAEQDDQVFELTDMPDGNTWRFIYTKDWDFKYAYIPGAAGSDSFQTRLWQEAMQPPRIGWQEGGAAGGTMTLATVLFPNGNVQKYAVPWDAAELFKQWRSTWAVFKKLKQHHKRVDLPPPPPEQMRLFPESIQEKFETAAQIPSVSLGGKPGYVEIFSDPSWKELREIRAGYRGGARGWLMPGGKAYLWNQRVEGTLHLFMATLLEREGLESDVLDTGIGVYVKPDAVAKTAVIDIAPESAIALSRRGASFAEVHEQVMSVPWVHSMFLKGVDLKEIGGMELDPPDDPDDYPEDDEPSIFSDFDFDESLTEANLQQREWEKYAREIYQHDIAYGAEIEDLVNRLKKDVTSVDPTGKRLKYASWIMKQGIVNAALNDPTIPLLLSQHAQLTRKNRIKGKARNIDAVEDLAQLSDLVKKSGTAREQIVMDGGEIVYDNGADIVVKVTTPTAAGRLGAVGKGEDHGEAEWCARQPGTAVTYLQNGELYFVYTEKPSLDSDGDLNVTVTLPSPYKGLYYKSAFATESEHSEVQGGLEWQDANNEPVDAYWIKKHSDGLEVVVRKLVTNERVDNYWDETPKEEDWEPEPEELSGAADMFMIDGDGYSKFEILVTAHWQEVMAKKLAMVGNVGGTPQTILADYLPEYIEAAINEIGIAEIWNESGGWDVDFDYDIDYEEHLISAGISDGTLEAVAEDTDPAEFLPKLDGIETLADEHVFMSAFWDALEEGYPEWFQTMTQDTGSKAVAQLFNRLMYKHQVDYELMDGYVPLIDLYKLVAVTKQEDFQRAADPGYEKRAQVADVSQYRLFSQEPEAPAGEEFAGGEYVYIKPKLMPRPYPPSTADIMGNTSGWIVPSSSNGTPETTRFEGATWYNVQGEQTGVSVFYRIDELSKAEQLVTYESFQVLVDKAVI